MAKTEDELPECTCDLKVVEDEWGNFTGATLKPDPDCAMHQLMRRLFERGLNDEAMALAQITTEKLTLEYMRKKRLEQDEKWRAALKQSKEEREKREALRGPRGELKHRPFEALKGLLRKGGR